MNKIVLATLMLTLYTMPEGLSVHAEGDLSVSLPRLDIPQVNMKELGDSLKQYNANEQMKIVQGLGKINTALKGTGTSLEQVLKKVPVVLLVHQLSDTTGELAGRVSTGTKTVGGKVATATNADYAIDAIKKKDWKYFFEKAYCSPDHRCPLGFCCRLYPTTNRNFKKDRGHCVAIGTDGQKGCPRYLVSYADVMKEVWKAMTTNSKSKIDRALQTAQQYIQKGEAVNSDSEIHPGLAPIHRAAAVSNIDTIRYLVNKQEAKVNLTLKNGWTPLMSAVKAENINGVKALIGNGASLGIRSSGKTALDMAKNNQSKAKNKSTNEKIIKLLEAAQ